MKGFSRLRSWHCGWSVLFCALIFLAGQPVSAGQAIIEDNIDKETPEASAQPENTTRRRKRTRWRSLLAPHERPERPRLA